VTFNAIGTSGLAVVYLSNSPTAAAPSYSSTSGNGIYIWGAQLEETDPATMAPTAYIKTTSQALAAPRFDHDPVTGESLGLLVEEERANAFSESEFRNGYLADSALRSGLLSDVSFSGLFENTGVAFGHDGATVSYVYKLGVATSSTVTFSVFVRMDDGEAPSFGSSSATNSSNDFVIVLGALVASPLTYSVEDYGNGMYRVSVTATSGTASANTGILKYNTNSSRTFKVSGYQIENSASFPTSYIPTTSTSQLRYADIAAVQDEDFSTTNLLAYSESFDVGWTTARLRPVVANATTAPDGNTTADYIEQAAGQTNAGVINQTVSVSGENVFSVYAKAAEKTFLRLALVGGTNALAYFNLSTCEVGTTANSPTFASAESVGNGWCKLSLGENTSGSILFAVYLADADNSSTVTDSGGIYLWGASLTATEYPVEYTTTRNLLTDSQDFERSTWARRVSPPTVVTYDAAQAPDGTTTAVEISANYLRRTEQVVAGASYTTSAYIKNNGVPTIRFYSQIEGGGSYLSFLIDTSTWSVTSNTFSNSPTIVDVGNGWKRVSIVETAASSGSFQCSYWQNDNAYPGSGSFYLWGAQLEPGTTATDYVRTVDTVGKDYGWFENTEGTTYVDFENTGHSIRVFAFIGNAADSQRWTQFYVNTTSTFWEFGTGAKFFSGVTVGDYHKVAAARQNLNNQWALDGSASSVLSDSAEVKPTLLYIGGNPYFPTRYLNGHIRRLTYWPTRQSDSTLQVITE
jgi:hypothetical protein